MKEKIEKKVIIISAFVLVLVGLLILLDLLNLLKIGDILRQILIIISGIAGVVLARLLIKLIIESIIWIVKKIKNKINA